ncbi:MAG TPA: hypothetical protein O0X66_05790 [Methanocorpusculum sp.]|nr:hypothetical protein [Methanocorpusculum sp.]HJJ53996.1 hypothetical protein [Methanocorpusculum sp.]
MYEKAQFITRIEEQIRVEEDYTQILENGKRRLSRSKFLILIPFTLLIISIIIFGLSSGSFGRLLMLWIQGSFYLYMFYFFLMMIPSIGSDANVILFDKKFRVYAREFLRLDSLLRTVKTNPLTLIEIFWNAFLINTKPLVKGFTILYVSDLLCAITMHYFGIIDWTLFLLLVVQIGIILLFYSRITAAKPGTPGFFVGKPQTGNINTSSAGLKTGLYIGFFSIITCFIIVGAMFFPGMTIAEILQDVILVPGEFTLILALILVTQGFLLRYFHGVESRKQMAVLNKRHLIVLKGDLLPQAYAAGRDDLPDLKREFLLFTMNKLIVQEFFSRFPAYILMPNLLLVLDPVAQEILMESGEDKNLKDML